MDYFGILICLIAIIGVVVCDDDQADKHHHHHKKLTITPSDTEVVHFVNDSYFVNCNLPTAESKIQWRSPKGDIIREKKGRVHIEERSTGQLALVLEHITLGDKGNWSCTVENGIGKAQFKLVVNQPISFMDTDTMMAVREGQQATIRCEVKGDPEPTVSWYLNGKPIDLSTKNKFTKLADGLLIKSVGKNDTGEYTCKAYQISEAVNDVQEQTILLKIKHPPQWIHDRNFNKSYAYLNGIANLTCEALAEPPANFTWKRAGKKQQIKTKHVVHIEPNISTLQLHVDDASVFGDYICKAKNDIDGIEKTITLLEGTKPDPPSIFQLRGFNSNTFDLDLGAVRTTKDRDPMDVNGYVIQYITEYDFKSVGGNWSFAKVHTVPFEDGVTYLINHLEPNTTFLMRAAAKNVAGLSNWTKVEKFTTLSNEPPKSSANSMQFNSNLVQSILTLSSISAIFNKFFIDSLIVVNNILVSDKIDSRSIPIL